jgi:hypothetical protein
MQQHARARLPPTCTRAARRAIGGGAPPRPPLLLALLKLHGHVVDMGSGGLLHGGLLHGGLLRGELLHDEGLLLLVGRRRAAKLLLREQGRGDCARRGAQLRRGRVHNGGGLLRGVGRRGVGGRCGGAVGGREAAPGAWVVGRPSLLRRGWRGGRGKFNAGPRLGGSMRRGHQACLCTCWVAPCAAVGHARAPCWRARRPPRRTTARASSSPAAAACAGRQARTTRAMRHMARRAMLVVARDGLGGLKVRIED